MRYQFWLGLWCLFLPLVSVVAADRAPSPAEVNASIERAAAHLISHQHSSGAIVNDGDQFSGRRREWKEKIEQGKIRPIKHSTALTSLSILGLAAVGHQPSDPTDEGRAMAAALDYVLDEHMVDKRGYLGHADHSRMYGHGIATLMLTEMIGMGKDEKQDIVLRNRAEGAIELILRSQKTRKKSAEHEGGWRYLPDSNDSDISVTVWQVLALRSAKNAGLKVPKQAIDDAIKYLLKCYSSDREADGTPKNLLTGFGYHGRGHPEFATSAAGLLSLQVCGQYDLPEVRASSDYLLEKKTPKEDDRWFFYGMYYYAQGMSQRGGEYAGSARQITETLLLKKQNRDGSFEGVKEEKSKVYATSLALLSLSVQHHYLPIYQR